MRSSNEAVPNQLSIKSLAIKALRQSKTEVVENRLRSSKRSQLVHPVQTAKQRNEPLSLYHMAHPEFGERDATSYPHRPCTGRPYIHHPCLDIHSLQPLTQFFKGMARKTSYPHTFLHPTAVLFHTFHDFCPFLAVADIVSNNMHTEFLRACGER